MIKKTGYLLLIPLWFLSHQLEAQNNIKKEDSIEPSKVESEEKHRLRKILNGVNKLITDSYAQLNNDKFESANQLYIKASDILKTNNISGVYVSLAKDKLNDLKNDISYYWAQNYELKARALFLKKDYAQAMRVAKMAIDKNPRLESSLEDFIESCKRNISSVNFVNSTKLENIDRDNHERKNEIKILLKKAKILFKNQKYTEARDYVEKVIMLDPYNIKAIDILKHVYSKLYFYASQRRENEILERIAEIKWKWSEPVLPTGDIKPEPVSSTESNARKSGIYDKLQNIVLDHIDFDEANLGDVIKWLTDRSKQVDPEKKGIQVMLKTDDVGSLPPISLTFDAIPIGEVIRYLCQATGLKFRIEERVVIIGNENIDEMETRFFKVRAALIQSMSSAEDSGDDDDDDMMQADADLVDTSTVELESGRQTATSSATSEALKKYFSDRGVPFPEGATIAYDRRTAKLIVKNTPEHLRSLESLLRDLDIQTPLVLIEAKIIEITQNDLEELGFDWLLTQTSPLTNRHLAPVKNGSAFSFDPDMPWLGPTPTEPPLNTESTFNTGSILRNLGQNNRLVNNLAILPNMGSDGNRNLMLSIYAIDRTDRAEVLSAPKVIASSGSTAVIRMVREEYFPESWTEPELTISTDNNVVIPSIPEFGDPRDLGVRFEVTPTVSPNNYTINLSLHPQIVEFLGWDTTYTYDIIVSGSATLNVPVRMGRFGRRDIVTNVKVYDGETVVLGGILREENHKTEDKIPGLGDLPIIGRLFKSINEQSTKNNLLMFVTARLVSNDGVPIRSDALRGIPDFHR